MPHRQDALHNFRRYDDMAHPYSAIDDLSDDYRPDIMDDYGRYEDMAFPYPEFDSMDDLDHGNDDWWDSDPFFLQVTSEQDFLAIEKLLEEIDHRQEAEDQEYFKFENRPLRHLKKKRMAY